MAVPKDFFSRFPPVLFVVAIVAFVAVVALFSVKNGSLQLGSDQNRLGSATSDGVTAEAGSGLRRETVTCNFLNAYSAFGVSYMNCSSTRGSCQVWANATAPSPSCTALLNFKITKATKLTWSSSRCYGTPTTTLDGVSENITFQCNPNLPLSCTDPDGVNYTRATNVTVQIASGAIYTLPDICFNSSLLLERLCNGATPYNQSFNCPNGCAYGACGAVVTCQDECIFGSYPTCFNSSHVQSCGNNDADSCSDIIFTKVCAAWTTCSGGTCITPNKCSDADLTNNIYVKSYINYTYNNINYTQNDSCVLTGYGQFDNVTERTCTGTNSSFLNLKCEFGCIDGACQTCRNDCSTIGASQCLNSAQVQLCGNNDADACNDWITSNCQSATSCISGFCAPDQCFDSDALDSHTLGWLNVTGNGTKYVQLDVCKNATAVSEGYCAGNSSQSTTINCANNCTRGICY